MTPKYKVTRARSEEKKKEQFERILEIGKELFTKKGIGGFSMRNLAQKLDMTKNNLYNSFKLRCTTNDSAKYLKLIQYPL